MPKVASPAWTQSEIDRKEAVLRGETVLANMRGDKALIAWARENGKFVLIDRKTFWGNPFKIGEHGDRAEVIEKYRQYFQKKESLHPRCASLRGMVLGCWCYPESCHGDVIRQWVEKAGAQATG